MREDAVDLVDGNAGKGDQVVPNAQQRLPLHNHVIGKQQVEVFCDGAGQGILDRNRGCVHRAGNQRGKDVGGERDRDDDGVGDQIHRGLVAEGAGFSLDGDLHCGLSFWRARNLGTDCDRRVVGVLSGTIPQLDR